MEAPDKVYIEIDNKAHVYFGLQPENAVEYIRKDALLEWAKEKQNESLTIVADDVWQELIDKLNSI